MMDDKSHIYRLGELGLVLAGELYGQGNPVAIIWEEAFDWLLGGLAVRQLEALELGQGNLHRQVAQAIKKLGRQFNLELLQFPSLTKTKPFSDQAWNLILTEIIEINRKLSPEEWGELLLFYRSHQLIIVDGKLTLQGASKWRRDRGQYFTPPETARRLVDLSLGAHLKKLRQRHGRDVLDEVAKLKIVDPACGGGSFLLAAYECLFDFYRECKSSTDYPKQILENMLYGVDLDRKAINLTRFLLALEYLKHNNNSHVLPTMNICSGNALVPGMSSADNHEAAGKISDEPFFWEDQFPHGKFDFVIGNPPWSSLFFSRFSRQAAPELARFFQRAYPFLERQKRISTSMLFLGLADSLLNDGGRVVYLLNQELFGVKAYQRARRLLLEKFDLEIIIEHASFPGVNINAAGLVARRNNSRSKRAVRWYRNLAEESYAGAVFPREFETNYQLNFYFSPLRDIIDKIKSHSQRLGEVAKISTGMCITRGDFCANERPSDEWHRGLFGANVSRYRITWPTAEQERLRQGRGKYFCFSQAKADQVNQRLAAAGSQTVKVLGREERFRQPKLLVRQSPTGPFIEAAYDDQNYYAEQTLHVINNQNQNEDELFYLLALLNSDLISWYARETRLLLYADKKPPQIRTQALKELPIPLVAENKKKQLVKLGRELTEAMDKEKIEKINRMVYEMFGLTDKEIKRLKNDLIKV